jgi:hypothetical protein
MRVGWYVGYFESDITPLCAVGKPQFLDNIYENQKRTAEMILSLMDHAPKSW